MAAKSQDDFVDLYEILELPTDAESEPIRQRLNVLYLEAQQNLDHRNAKKRLQYQQMYEVYLPQARHLLLDGKRRAEYDRYLTAYQTGGKVAPSEKSESEIPMPSGPVIEEPPLPGMAEVAPEVLAAEREDIWAKWKHGLEIVGENEDEDEVSAEPEAVLEEAVPEVADASATSVSTPTTPSLPPFARRRPAPPQRAGTAAARPALPQRPGSAAPQRPTPPRPTPPGTTPQRPASRPPGLSKTPPVGARGGVSIGADAEAEAEAQREAQREAARMEELEKQRYQITRDAVQNAGLLWGAAYAIGILIVGCLLLFALVSRIKIPLGLSTGTFSGICLIVVLAATLGGGYMARRKAKQRIAMELSLLPIEELLRRSRS